MATSTTDHPATMPDVPVDDRLRGRIWTSPWARRGSLAALLGGTALLYLWNLGASGDANDFYAAAVQAGTKSWKAFFFGSFDSSNFITVDKPPAALWPMEIAGRIFGFGSWSMLAPQAIEGVLAVWLLYATVRRWFGHGAGLLAGLLLAITPVAALMFRFNNPDALMVLLIVVAAYCTVRALEVASTRWLVLAGLVMGCSFLAKGLQPFTVLPALALAYLICAPAGFWRRVLQLLGAGVAMVVGAGWWVLAVDLTPAADRPYIGGSGNNTALGLAFGYNGVSRITGGSGVGGASFSGSTGIGRMFNDLDGGQIAWLLPTAAVALIGTLVVAVRRSRTDRTLAALIVFSGWLLVTGGLLSFAGGIIHTYYTVELAPAIAALVAIGTVTLWRVRGERLAARILLAVGAAVTGVWTFTLLDRTPDWFPWLRWVLLVVAAGTAALLLVLTGRLRRSFVAVVAVVGVVSLGGGSAAFAVDAASTPQTGSTPSAGPTVSGASGFGGGGFPGGGGRGFGRGNTGTGGFPGASGSSGSSGLPGGSDGLPSGLPGGLPSGLPGGSDGLPGGSGGLSGSASSGRPSSMTAGAGMGGTRTASSAVTALLEKTTTTWAAATIGSQTAAPLELASGKAVMAIGGFSGSDAAPTLAQFETYVGQGRIRYFIGSGSGGGFGGGSGTGSSISSWVSSHFSSTTVGGTTVYDLSKEKAPS